MSSVNRWLTRFLSSASEVLETNRQRKTQAVVAFAGTLVTISMWLAHLSYPDLFSSLIHREGVNKLFIALVLAPPFVAAFSIGQLVVPKLNEPVGHASGPMSGYLHIDSAERKWRVAITAGMVTAANFLLMMATSHSG